MKCSQKKSAGDKGFLIVELLIAIGITGLVFAGFLQIQSAFLRGKQEGIIRTKAAYRATEAFEVVRYIRERDGWNAIADIPTTFLQNWRCPVIKNGDWELLDISEEPCSGLEYLDNSYLRVISFNKINRTDGAIDENGSEDSESRMVTAALHVTDDITKIWAARTRTFTFETVLTSWEDF